jgi:transketolase
MTIEENTILGGLGGIVAEIILESSYRPQSFKRLGIPDIFPDKYGNQPSLMKHYGLEGGAIAETTLKWLKENR